MAVIKLALDVDKTMEVSIEPGAFVFMEIKEKDQVVDDRFIEWNHLNKKEESETEKCLAELKKLILSLPFVLKT